MTQIIFAVAGFWGLFLLASISRTLSSIYRILRRAELLTEMKGSRR